VIRVVVDPGVLIAALISPSGAPAQVFVHWLAGRFDLVVSPRLISEPERVLARRKFREYVSRDEASAFVDAIARQAVVLDDPPGERGLTPDPGDDYIVSLARQAGASVIVSGDRHLTGVRGLNPPVATAREFLQTLERA
jgi:putative PIN family toxin of toxin-antitoxin system